MSSIQQRIKALQASANKSSNAPSKQSEAAPVKKTSPTVPSKVEKPVVTAQPHPVVNIDAYSFCPVTENVQSNSNATTNSNANTSGYVSSPSTLTNSSNEEESQKTPYLSTPSGLNSSKDTEGYSRSPDLVPPGYSWSEESQNRDSEVQKSVSNASVASPSAVSSESMYETDIPTPSSSLNSNPSERAPSSPSIHPALIRAPSQLKSVQNNQNLSNSPYETEENQGNNSEIHPSLIRAPSQILANRSKSAPITSEVPYETDPSSTPSTASSSSAAPTKEQPKPPTLERKGTVFVPAKVNTDVYETDIEAVPPMFVRAPENTNVNDNKSSAIEAYSSIEVASPVSKSSPYDRVDVSRVNISKAKTMESIAEYSAFEVGNNPQVQDRSVDENIYGTADNELVPSLQNTKTSYDYPPPEVEGENQGEEYTEEEKKPYDDGLHRPIVPPPRDFLTILFAGTELEVQKSSQNQNDISFERDWNDEYQSILEMEDSKDKFESLKGLASDFVYAAETYGRIIISENCLPVSEKTIKPVSVGGVAGGQKYIVCGILFKFCIDQFGLYGGDHNAMKAASHELKGLQQYYYCGIPELRVPLMAFIDYRGWRLQAVSLLPIESDSLVYGSADGGRTVLKEEPVLNECMERAAKSINIKAHKVGPLGYEQVIHSCCDIEGHKGTDGRFYLLDFARVAPSQPPSSKGENLYNLFRFEFIRAYQTALSSDVFSMMGKNDSKVHSDEAMMAYDHLLNNTISEFIKEVVPKVDKKSMNSKDLLEEMHRKGINYRFMGLIRAGAKESVELRNLILHEAVARVCKTQMGQALREVSKNIGIPSNEPFTKTITILFNTILGKDDRSEEYWRMMSETLSRKFAKLLSPQEKDVKSLIKFDVLFRRILELTRIEMAPGSLDNINTENFEFVQPDILETRTRVTHLDIIEFADGMYLYHEADGRDEPDVKLRLLELAKSRLEISMKSMSSNQIALLQLGNIFMLIAKTQFKLGKGDWEDSLNAAQKIYSSIQSDNRADLGVKFSAMHMAVKSMGRRAIWIHERKASSEANWDAAIKLGQEAIEMNPNGRDTMVLVSRLLLEKVIHKNLDEEVAKPELELALNNATIALKMTPEKSKRDVGRAKSLIFQINYTYANYFGPTPELIQSLASQFEQLSQDHTKICEVLLTKLDKKENFSKRIQWFTPIQILNLTLLPMMMAVTSPAARELLVQPHAVALEDLDLSGWEKSKFFPCLTPQALAAGVKEMTNLKNVNFANYTTDWTQVIEGSKIAKISINMQGGATPSDLLKMAQTSPTVVSWELIDLPSLVENGMEEFFAEIGPRCESLKLSRCLEMGMPSAGIIAKHLNVLTELKFTGCNVDEDIVEVINTSNLNNVKRLKLGELKSEFTQEKLDELDLPLLEIFDLHRSNHLKSHNIIQKHLSSLKMWRYPEGHFEWINDEELTFLISSQYNSAPSFVIADTKYGRQAVNFGSPSNQGYMANVFRTDKLSEHFDSDCVVRFNKTSVGQGMTVSIIRQGTDNFSVMVPPQMGNMLNYTLSVPFSSGDKKYTLKINSNMTGHSYSGRGSFTLDGNTVGTFNLTHEFRFTVLSGNNVFHALVLGALAYTLARKRF
eukprot:TRINITY_DN1709_c0_g1_i1.p1 TRINITY_DN1709_c0_g1~~TRINITY_DN1709_c0_g1_i1.p1  ORF type:complete len:1608 (-),score=618.00 TRINITY_DN1709_c0_g1_i1:52-4875(-)